MKDINRISQKRSTFGKHNRALLMATLFTAGLLFVVGGFFGLPAATSTRVAAAQVEFQGGATQEMLDYALNFGRAGDFAVFGGRRVVNRGQSNFRGLVGTTGNMEGVPGELDGESRQNHGQAKQDLKDTLKWIGHLPCADVNDPNLAGRTFTPGVYCLPSADLSGEMTIDARGDANARFVFRISGGLETGDESSIRLIAGARASNVYIIADGPITIGDESSIRANVISKGSVTIGAGTDISGKSIGADGDIDIESSSVGPGTGVIEICKALSAGDPIATGTIFTFNITGGTQNIQVPAGSCSAPITVAAGNVTVTEAARADTAVVGIVTNPANRRVSFSLALRQVVVAVPEGDVTNETIITFTNQTTRTGTIEICKRALDSDVSGFFEFTVQGAPGQTFAVPVGFCSRAINVTILQVPQSTFTTNVTELARPNFRLENVTTFPVNRLNGPFTPNQGFDANGAPLEDNTNGGFANVTLIQNGGVASQTTVNFFNRSLPGVIKVCKITADTNAIPLQTLFRFTVSGLAPTSPTQTLPGTQVTRTIDVPAGPDSQGGFCRFVDGTFVVGEPVTIVETGLAPGQTLPNGFTFADTRVSRIRASTPILSSNLETRTVVINARNTTATVDFTNFVFRPAILKLCKVAGAGVNVGTNFTFNIALVNPLTSRPVSSAPITVPAGSCTFVNGPFPAVEQFPGIGTFNLNTQLIVTEQAAAGVNVTAITSPSGSPISANLAARAGTITFNRSALASTLNFNEIEFTNSAAPVAPAEASVRYDFDGDGISDPVIFRPSTGTWWYGASSAGGSPRADRFGIATDRLAAADYDGDGRTDTAVYRDGEWHIYDATRGYAVHRFGFATDIPQPGDYDGDGRADMAVYRPSDGYWHVLGSRDGYIQIRFGISTDMPVAADYDGDGRMDVAVYRSGTWYILGSTRGFVAHQFGIGGDKPIAADYDGDGQVDLAVVRSGVWHILRTRDGYMQTPFGQPSDSPVPADYDGDGRTDMAVYRSSTNMWHILRSSSTEGAPTTVQFGSAGDMLMPY